MERVDLTFDGELDIRVNVVDEKKTIVNYTIEGDTGKTTTTSILINEDPLLMVTFDYQKLKEICEGKDE